MNQQEWNATVDKLALDDLQKLGRGRVEAERDAVVVCYRMRFGEELDKHEDILRMAPNERWWAACAIPKTTWEEHPTGQEENWRDGGIV